MSEEFDVSSIPPNAKDKKDSPNTDIDRAIKALMKEISGKKTGKDGEVIDQPMDVKVKVINTAINWEKVKHNIKDATDWDPSSI